MVLFSDLVAGSDLRHGTRQPLLAMLHSAAHGFDAGHDWSGVHHLTTVQDRIRDRVTPVDDALAEQWVWIAQEIIDAFGEVKSGMAGTAKMEQDAHGKRTLRFDASRNRPYLVEASVDFLNWDVVGAAVERSSGSYEFTDPDNGTAPWRFYRLRMP